MTDINTRTAILREAESLINGDRAATYGPPDENFARIARGWEVILGVSIRPDQVALAMAWLKIARLSHGQHLDGYIDGVGYLALAGELSSGR